MTYTFRNPHGRRLAVATLLSAAATLAACGSPMANNDDDRMYSSMIARVVGDSLTREDLRPATGDGGVREHLVRIDDAGMTSAHPIGLGFPVPAAATPSIAAVPKTGTLLNADAVPAAATPLLIAQATGAAVSPAQAPATSPLNSTADAPPPPTTREAESWGLDAVTINTDEGPPLDMSLHDAIHRAMDHSLAIKVEAYNPAIKESQVIQAEGNFDPVLFVNSNWTNTDEPLVQSGVFTNGQSWNNQIGIKQLLPTGATAQLSTNINYRDVTIPEGGFNSLNFRFSYTTNINLQITQPLLRGFGTDVTEANIYVARKDQRVSLETFKRQVITTCANVEEAYHNLVQAQANRDILKGLVDASTITYTKIYNRRGIDVDITNLSQALGALRSRQADLLVAEKTVREASDRLKVLLDDPAIDIHSNVVIHAIDKPLEEPMHPDMVSAIDTALRQRTEITEARLQVEKSDIAVAVAKNGLLPQLDLTAGIQTNGLENDLGSSISQNLDPINFLDETVGIKLSIPLGYREAQGQLTQRQLERRQGVTQLMNVALTVVTDVRIQLREMLASYSEIEIRELTRQAAAAEFRGLVAREDIEKLTPEYLQLELDSQARLAQAEQNRVQAIINYNLAIMRLEQAKGTLLEFNQISLDRPPKTDEDVDVGKLRILDKTYEKK